MLRGQEQLVFLKQCQPQHPLLCCFHVLFLTQEKFIQMRRQALTCPVLVDTIFHTNKLSFYPPSLSSFSFYFNGPTSVNCITSTRLFTTITQTEDGMTWRSFLRTVLSLFGLKNNTHYKQACATLKSLSEYLRKTVPGLSSYCLCIY